MEAHYHPNVEKNNYKEYFLKLLMIFLALTLGFFAKSLRALINDNSKDIGWDEEIKTADPRMNKYLQKEYHLENE